MSDFKELRVWQKAHEMTLLSYHVTAEFPKEEMYGLMSQLPRARVSIGANIPEGCGRRSDATSVDLFKSPAVLPVNLTTSFYWQRSCAFVREDFWIVSRQSDEIQRMLTSLM